MTRLFWFPRTLFGIEPHLYAFYDQVPLLHRINHELAALNMRVVEELFPVLTPDFVGLAEDMSYNPRADALAQTLRGTSAPYYRMLIPHIKRHGIDVLVDSDGDVMPMIPWLLKASIDGVYPLERQAAWTWPRSGTAVLPLLMMGGYDKMVMSRGEAAMRPSWLALAGHAIGWLPPSVDHRTPPGVSLSNTAPTRVCSRTTLARRAS